MKVSETQLDVLGQMRESGKIERLSGGFWTTPGMSFDPRGAPDWHVTVQTIRAMEKKGLLERREGESEPEWCAARYLTDLGRQVLEES